MLIRLYKSKFDLPPLPPPDSFKGKNVLITGGNTGLGLASAVHCMNFGAKLVIITSRDSAKGDAAKAFIKAQTSGKGTVRVMHLDMSTLQGVRIFAEEVKREVHSIDFVLLNAGVNNLNGRVSPDGWENSLQVNVLSTTLLALLLLPWLKVAGKGNARLSITGSGMHRGIDIDAKNGWPQQDVLQYWNNQEHFKKAGGSRMYAISKLLVLYAMREIALLARTSHEGYVSPKLENNALMKESPQVVVSAMCPGSMLLCSMDFVACAT